MRESREAKWIKTKGKEIGFGNLDDVKIRDRASAGAGNLQYGKW